MAGRVQSAAWQLLRELSQSGTVGLTNGKVHRRGGFGHEVSLADRKSGSPWLALFVPAKTISSGVVPFTSLVMTSSRNAEGGQRPPSRIN